MTGIDAHRLQRPLYTVRTLEREEKTKKIYEKISRPLFLPGIYYQVRISLSPQRNSGDELTTIEIAECNLMLMSLHTILLRKPSY